MLFEIIKRPDGSAPDGIRDAWIGLELEADEFPVMVPVEDSTGKNNRKERLLENPL